MRGIGGTLAYLDQSVTLSSARLCSDQLMFNDIQLRGTPQNPMIPEIQRHDHSKISDFLRILLIAATCGIWRDSPPRIVDQGSRLLGKMQGYVQGHTPLETQRVCYKAALGTHRKYPEICKCLGQMLT